MLKPRLVTQPIPAEIPEVVTTTREIDGYAIQRGVPIPKPGGGLHKPQGFNRVSLQLEVGESFSVQEWTERKRQHLHKFMERHGRKVKTRKEKDGTLRIWRIE